MIRSIVLAASAIALAVAAPASAAEMRVKVAGKSAAEVRAEIVKAASTVCWQDVRGEALAGYLYPACIRASVNDAVAKINNPALTAYNTANPSSGAVVARYATSFPHRVPVPSVQTPPRPEPRRVLLV